MARATPKRYWSSGKRNRVGEPRARRSFSPADLLDLWEPTGARKEQHGLAVGEGSRLKLDVYRPRHAAKAPVLVFFLLQ